MSIIQEALRKAQRTEVPRETSIPKHVITPKAEESVEKVNKISGANKPAVPLLYILIFLALFSAIAIKYFSKGFSGAPANQSAPVAKKAAPMQAAEPVVEKQAAPQPVPVAPLTIQIEDFTLSGIMNLETGPRAIVNGMTVVEGDVVDGAVVGKITDSSVLLKRRNSELVLHLK